MTSEVEIPTFRASTTRWAFGSLAGWLTLALCLVAVGLVILVVKWVQNISRRYVLTDQRLIIKTGIIFKNIDEIELYRVKDVTVDFSLLNQLTDIGNISIRSSDVTSSEGVSILRDIPGARAVREQLRSLVDDARQRRQVREMDVDLEHR